MTPSTPVSSNLPHTAQAPNKAPKRKTEMHPGSAAKKMWLGLASAASWHQIGVPTAVLGILLAMVTPLPAFVLDLLISLNLTLSVIILLVAMSILRPVEFSIFPTALLLMTLFRLALNLSSARLILLEGNSGTAAAGRVIEAFGQFVVGGNYIIGAVIFIILIAIQYVVINHGAVRISEVTARFTLDALPGKQMSIDSDLNAGLIDEAEARARRKKLAAEAEFYGAMDGASRFTQRDAVASLLITAVNIFAGILIGVFQHGMEVRRALETYAVLTIGDGLVTVIPALMISISGGIIVTRASSDAGLEADFRQQLFGNSQPLTLASGVLIAMAGFPGLPAVPFLALGAGLGYLSYRMRRKEEILKEEMTGPSAAQQPKENLESLLRVDLLAIEVGLGLVRLVEGGPSSALLRRINAIRRQMAVELGFLLPPVRVTDNLSLRAAEYVVLLKGMEIGRFELPPGHELAIAGAHVTAKLDGIPTTEPAFGMEAIWIPSARAEQARLSGYTVVDSVSVLGTHLTELIRRFAHELFSRQDAKKFLDRVLEEHPKVVEDLVPKLVGLATVQKVLQNLLRERVSIRDAVSILESLGEAAQMTKNPVVLTEFVRQSIRRVVVKPYQNAAGDLPVYFLDPALEKLIEQAIEHGETTSHFALGPQQIKEILSKIVKGLNQQDVGAVLLTSASIRFFVRQILEQSLPHVAVLSHNEIPAGVRVISLGTIGGP
ncbi:MAG: flagellar biosynthesis protein FlhA [Bryobacteraceae bacterium]|nr:flagellar biosynthesis protein FlhA [Bryobacteraceae bacterium]MDW8380046.1 flagellar biosynthesis protein FlhA [Bryobacterales bacterium]